MRTTRVKVVCGIRIVESLLVVVSFVIVSLVALPILRTPLQNAFYLAGLLYSEIDRDDRNHGRAKAILERKCKEKEE